MVVAWFSASQRRHTACPHARAVLEVALVICVTEDECNTAAAAYFYSKREKKPTKDGPLLSSTVGFDETAVDYAGKN